MENYNNQNSRFKDLSAKKKTIHYVGWSLLVLGCVGTIVFGTLWCKNKNQTAPTIDPLSGEAIEINFVKEDGSDGFYLKHIESPKLNQIYQFNFDIKILAEKDTATAVYSVGFIVGFGDVGQIRGETELTCLPQLYINGERPIDGAIVALSYSSPDEGNPFILNYMSCFDADPLDIDLENTQFSVRLKYKQYEDNENPDNKSVLVGFGFDYYSEI